MVMRVFVTGATGFVGSAIVSELIHAGHKVLGLTRTDAGAQALLAAGAEVHRGDLEDIEGLRIGAAKADAVIHTAFNHDFLKFKTSCEDDRQVIETLGSMLAGSDRPFIVTSGTSNANIVPGQPALEENRAPSSSVVPRAASEEAAAAVAARGVNVSVVRLPQVHNTVKQGLVSYLIPIARKKGVSAYVGEGLNRWSAVHVLDAARLYRLALEKVDPGATYHSVAEEGVPFREIAEAIGRDLKVPAVSISPEEATAHFGGMAHFVGRDGSASSTLTQERLRWNPTGPGLIADLEQIHYEA